MRRSLILTALLVLASGPGCTFEDGLGWATLSATVKGSLEVDEAHASATGATLQASFLAESGEAVARFEVTVQKLRATVLSLGLLETTSATGGGGGTFDPASPPPGYTLCHGGHCHTEAGGIESYEEIRARMSGAQTGPVQTVASTIESGAALDLLEAASLELGAHEQNTISLSGVRLVLSGFELRGTVSLDGAEVPIEVGIPQEIQLDADVSAALGEGGLEEAKLDVALVITAGLLDGIRFDYLQRDGGVIRIDAEHNDAAYETLLSRVALFRPTAAVVGQ